MTTRTATLLALLLMFVMACPTPRGGGGRDDDDAGDDDDSAGDDDDATGDDDDATGDDDDATGDDDDATGDDDDANGDDDDATGDDDDATGDDDDATGDDDDSTVAQPVAPATGDLAIVEILSDPNGNDATNEWFEVANVSGGPIELMGCTLAFFNYAASHTIPGSLVLDAGDRIVFGNNGNPAQNGGVPVDYTYGGIELEEEADIITITNPSGAVVDEVSWQDFGGVGSWPVVDDWSMVLDVGLINGSAASANDNPDNWCQEASYTPYAPGNADVNYGTPGAPSTVSCFLPASGNLVGDVVINEYMPNPIIIGDAYAEWFELHNTTNTAIDLFGWHVYDGEWDEIRILQNLVIPALGYVVLGRYADTSINGGAPVDYAYFEELFLSNVADELILLDPAKVQIDIVEYDEAQAWVDPTGYSAALAPASTLANNNDPSNWCQHASTTSTGASAVYDANGNVGTPGAANVCAQ